MAVQPNELTVSTAYVSKPEKVQLQQAEHQVPEDVSTSITQTWTDQAIKCYMTKSDCANCVIPKGGYSFECQMNKVVPVLLNTLGAPETRRVERLMPYLYS